MFHLFISNFKFKLWTKFFLVFLGTFFAAVSFLEYILLKTGETLSYEKVWDRQIKTNEYYGVKYFDIDEEYKVLGIKKMHPDIVSFGSSRIMELKKSDWNPNVKFYNASLPSSVNRSFIDWTDMLGQLNENEMPTTILISIDLWMFNPNYHFNAVRHKPLYYLKRKLKKTDFGKNLANIKRHYQYYLRLINEDKKTYSLLLNLKSRRGIGLLAISRNTGFTTDGSYIYPQNRVPEKVMTKEDWMKYFQKDKYRFPSAKYLDEGALKDFEIFLKFCKVKGINVVGILPPFRPDFYEALIGSKDKSVYFQEFRHKIPMIMKEFKYLCYDLSSPYELGLSNTDFFDSIHLTKSNYSIMLNKIKMPELKSYAFK